MDDLLNKIKETEKEAQVIVKKSESESNDMIDKKRSELAKLLDESRKSIHSKYMKIKESEINLAKEKKEKMIQEKTKEFENNFGNIDDRKKTARNYLTKMINEKYLN
jgi:hypothetical protein